MISDEMRELLSAYVDGELRDADAARVEDVSKRDPELRREIEAYRTLRRKLREWDAAEHGATPEPSFIDRMLARARTMDAALAAPPARARFLAPLAVAAALLVAVGIGYMLAGPAPAAPPQPEPGPVLALKAPGPAPSLALEGSALEPMRAPPWPSLVRTSRLDDHLPSRRALEFADAMRRAEVVRAEPPEPERKTGTTVSLEVKALLDTYEATDAPSEALVLLSRLPALNAVEAVEPASGRAIDQSVAHIVSKLAGRGAAVLSPLGEVWTAGDRRARVVAASTWVRRNSAEFLSVVRADEIATSADVEVQDFILGPLARERLLLAKAGFDPAFLAWLRGSYGGPLPDALERGARDRDRAVNRLVDALSRDKDATGFAVFDAKGRLLGTELFHDHAVMVAFAPRLLRGYVFEAGEDGIRVAPPAVKGGRREEVRKLLEGMPGRGLRVERERLDVAYGPDKAVKAAPDGVARITLFSASGRPVGHGIVHDETPIHLTLFGE